MQRYPSETVEMTMGAIGGGRVIPLIAKHLSLYYTAQQTADNSRDKMIRAESYIKHVVLFTAIGLLFLLRHLP
jgi:hypothetical protein